MSRSIRQPKKPTNPFGYISFSPDGTVSKHPFLLSQEKAGQESDAIRRFIEGYSKVGQSIGIRSFRPLPQDGHDFEFDTTSGTVTFQLTEIIERKFTKQVSAEEYHSGKYHSFVQKGFGEIPWAVDQQGVNESLKNAIQKKVSMYGYHRPAGVIRLSERVHARFHAVIENQVALAEPEAAPRALQRLRQEGLTRHEALHALGAVLARHIGHARPPGGEAGDARGRYVADLEGLSADWWRQRFARDEED